MSAGEAVVWVDDDDDAVIASVAGEFIRVWPDNFGNWHADMTRAGDDEPHVTFLAGDRYSAKAAAERYLAERDELTRLRELHAAVLECRASQLQHNADARAFEYAAAQSKRDRTQPDTARTAAETANASAARVRAATARLDAALAATAPAAPAVVATDDGAHPLRDLVYATEIKGGGWLVDLACGHRIATRTQSVAYPCRECATADNGARKGAG